MLRAEVVTHMRKSANKAKYAKEWDRELPDNTASDNFDEYIAAIEKHGTWCGHFELQALARMYNIKPVVFRLRTLDGCFVLHPKEKKRFAAFVFDGVHFDFLEPTEKQYPKVLTDVSNPPRKVPMRGGGRSRCCTVSTSTSATRHAGVLVLPSSSTSAQRLRATESHGRGATSARQSAGRSKATVPCG